VSLRAVAADGGCSGLNSLASPTDRDLVRALLLWVRNGTFKSRADFEAARKAARPAPSPAEAAAALELVTSAGSKAAAASQGFSFGAASPAASPSFSFGSSPSDAASAPLFSFTTSSAQTAPASAGFSFSSGAQAAAPGLFSFTTSSAGTAAAPALFSFSHSGAETAGDPTDFISGIDWDVSTALERRMQQEQRPQSARASSSRAPSAAASAAPLPRGLDFPLTPGSLRGEDDLRFGLDMLADDGKGSVRAAALRMAGAKAAESDMHVRVSERLLHV
jgi:hypothetical protein